MDTATKAQTNENETHYFASCALGWATDTTCGGAINRLVNEFHDHFVRAVRNEQKEGRPGAYLWVCEVMQPKESASYDIEYYQPVGVEKQKQKHCNVTYLTRKRIAYYLTDNNSERGIARDL